MCIEIDRTDRFAVCPIGRCWVPRTRWTVFALRAPPIHRVRADCDSRHGEGKKQHFSFPRPASLAAQQRPLCPKIIWKLINTHALVVVIKRFMKSHRGHMKFVECVDGRMILFNLKMPVYEGGANGESLRDAQYNFLKDHEDDGNSFGYKKDKNWTILSPPKEKISTNKMKTNFIVNKNGVISKN